LHEPAGRLLSGAAWHERRRLLIADLDHDALMLELGCGEGRLLSLAEARGMAAVGIDPSSAMLNRASKRARNLVRADARRLPFADETFHVVVASYPGPWIFDRETRRELARVCRTNAKIRVLLGGDYQVGPLGGFRRRLASAVYGGRALTEHSAVLERHLACTQLIGAVEIRRDRWGYALYWLASPTAKDR